MIGAKLIEDALHKITTKEIIAQWKHIAEVLEK